MPNARSTRNATLQGRNPEQDALFLHELRRVLPQWEFSPAEKDGRKVRQLMRQVVVFEAVADRD